MAVALGCKGEHSLFFIHLLMKSLVKTVATASVSHVNPNVRFVRIFLAKLQSQADTVFDFVSICAQQKQ